MKVYHGSYVKIDKIDLSKSKPNKDFGKGFYVTKFRHHAEEWAEIIGEKYETDGFVSEFEFSENDFTKSICKIKHFDAYNEEWLDFVVKNRDKNSETPAHNYDIVIVPVANDKVQNTLRIYLKGVGVNLRVCPNSATRGTQKNATSLVCGFVFIMLCNLMK